jgi:hypothetical protein
VDATGALEPSLAAFGAGSLRPRRLFHQMRSTSPSIVTVSRSGETRLSGM